MILEISSASSSESGPARRRSSRLDDLLGLGPGRYPPNRARTSPAPDPVDKEAVSILMWSLGVRDAENVRNLEVVVIGDEGLKRAHQLPLIPAIQSERTRDLSSLLSF